MANSKRAPRRILHTNDLHLATFGDLASQCLQTVVDLAIEAEVDLVIIAGDLFDHNKVKDDVVSFAVEQLRRLPVDTVILPGNHDCLVQDTVYNREDIWGDASNIRIFRAPHGEIFNFPDLSISMWGKPIDSYEYDVRPMEGIPQPEEDGCWHIAVAHGYYVDEDEPIFLSYHITEEEITTSGWDYVALGHYPVFRCICEEPVMAYYADSPPLFGSVNIVDFDEETGVQVNRYSL